MLRHAWAVPYPKSTPGHAANDIRQLWMSFARCHGSRDKNQLIQARDWLQSAAAIGRFQSVFFGPIAGVPDCDPKKPPITLQVPVCSVPDHCYRSMTKPK